TAAIPGTSHASIRPRSAGAARAAPTDAPQWWQKRAPLESGLPHFAQSEASSAAPQLAQNRPLTGRPQCGHFEEMGLLFTG
ncbi:MAG TPA: hypothetical protein VIH11_04570, partial [Gemmatimonadaceae bacterium]